MSIGLGIIGFGYWGPNLLRNFVADEQFHLLAVAEHSSAARDKARRFHRGADIMEDGFDLIARPEIDAVLIATPVATHYGLARAALNAGKHVFLEKPMCTSAAEAKELVALAARVGRVLMIDHTFLFTGAVQAMVGIVKSGELGKICYFDSMRVNLGLFQPDVNCLWDLAPHDLSIIDHILDKDVVAIDISGYCHVNPKLPDMVYLTLHYADHVVAHFNLSWMSPVKVRRFAIGGMKKMLVWDDLDQDQKIKVHNSGIDFQPEDKRDTIIPDYRIGDIYSPALPRREALAGVARHFANVIEGLEPSIMDGAKGLRVVRVLEEAQTLLNRNLATVAARQASAS